VAGKKPNLDVIDLLTLPLFAITMFAEHRSLRDRALRRLDEPDCTDSRRRR